MQLLEVAPLVGAWIEIIKSLKFASAHAVAPLVGAWIEILFPTSLVKLFMSLLSWERGLKSISNPVVLKVIRRSSRGSVD